MQCSMCCEWSGHDYYMNGCVFNIGTRNVIDPGFVVLLLLVIHMGDLHSHTESDFASTLQILPAIILWISKSITSVAVIVIKGAFNSIG